MLRKIALASLAFALVAGARADDLTTARARMADAFAHLAETGKFTITSTGEEQIGDVVRPLQISTAVEFTTSDGIPTVKLEQVVLRDGIVTHRIVGDGCRLWSWERSKNEYSSFVYQVDQGEPRENFLRQFVVNFVKWSPREASFNARLIQETFIGTNHAATWSPWNGPSDVTISEDPAGTTINCDSLTGSPTSMAYRVNLNGEVYELAGASIYREDQFNTALIQTTLSTQMYYDVLPPDTDYSFVPPIGSKSKAVTRPQTGG